MSEPVYVVVEVTAVHDPEGYADYARQARVQMAARGGKVVARDGRHFEGEPEIRAMMIQLWPSEAAWNEWQASEEYAPLKAVRLKSISLRLAVVPALAS